MTNNLGIESISIFGSTVLGVSVHEIKNTKIISYDCKHIYVWGVNPIKLEHKIPHNLTIPDEWQSGWWSNIVSKEIENDLDVDNLFGENISSSKETEVFSNLFL